MKSISESRDSQNASSDNFMRTQDITRLNCKENSDEDPYFKSSKPKIVKVS